MNTPSAKFLKSLVPLLPILLVSACGPRGETCGAGTRLEDGTCVPVCAPGAEVDPDSGRCVPTCGPGTHPGESGGCIPDSAACESGQVWDALSSQCLDVDALCAEGSTWVASEGACVPDDRLKRADYAEGYAENDPSWGGAGAVEMFELPAMGEAVTLSGRIDPPLDRNGDLTLEGDYDFWLFEADRPMLLRVHADGLGGATAGFEIAGLWEGSTFRRLGIGSTSDSVHRDIYLPREGLYALVATDGLHFVTRHNGPFVGGGDLGYFFEIERIPLPEPTPLTFDGQAMTLEGEWPTEPPATGSMIGFYELDVQAHHAYQFTLLSRGGVTQPELFVFGEESRFSISGTEPALMGWEGDDRLLLIVDQTMYFSYESHLEFLLDVYDLAISWVEEAMPPTAQTQQVWNLPDGAVPSVLYGTSAEAQEVVTVRAGSSTGRTCVSLWERSYQTTLEEWNCRADPDEPPRFDGELRILSPYAGFYGMSSIDWDGAVFEEPTGVVYIPPHDYDLSLDVRRQAPRDLGVVMEPFTLTFPLTQEAPEQYYFMDSDEGLAVAGTITADFPAQVQFYKPFLGKVTEAGGPRPLRFAWRSVDDQPAFFAVSHPLEEAGSFDLHLEPLDIPDLGPVAADQATELTLEVLEGSHGGVYRVAVPGPGTVEIQAQASDFGIVLQPRDLTLASSGDASFLGPFPGTPTRHVVTDEGLFFDVAPMAGPAPKTLTVTLVASFTPAVEEEPSSTMDDAQPLMLPAVVAGTAGGGDLDVYAVTLDGPKVVTLATLPDGEPSAGDTGLLLVGPNGDELAFDDDGGLAAYSRLEYEVEDPGTYFVVVFSRQQKMGGYVLEAKAEDPPGGGVIVIGE